MSSERIQGSAIAEDRGGSKADGLYAPQKPGVPAVRVDPNQANANASGVAAVATGMSLFYAFDKTVAAETGGSAIEGVTPTQETEAPVALDGAPAFAAGGAPDARPSAVPAPQSADAVVSALAPETGSRTDRREPGRSAGAVTGAESPDAVHSGVTTREAPAPVTETLVETTAATDSLVTIVPEAGPEVVPNVHSISALSDADAAANAVDENASTGTRVGITALATDGDSADRASYSLSDDAGGLFAIDALTGEVTVAGALDFENVDHYAIEVTATSSDGSVATMTYTIAINDVNEVVVSAVSDTDAAANVVNENAAVGTSVGITAFACDADGTSSVSYSLSDDAGGKFAIDATTGEVTVAGSLDREVAASYQIEVTATSTDGSTSTQTYTIGLNDQDEFNVLPLVDTNAAADGLAENAVAGTAVGVVASAADADATNNAISYSVDDARFTVDADGTVRVAAGASFDYETESSIGITVTATSADGSTSSQAFTLAASDVNEAAVSGISDTDAVGNTVNENAAVGTSIGITAFASDADGTATVSYSLSNDAGGKFAIDPTTGEVTVAGALDRETAASYQIEVTATSSDGSTSTQTYTIGLNDQDEFDVSPVVDTSASADGLAEDAAAGTAVGVVASASDADATNNAISYSVDDARFTVDADGTVRVAAGANFDYETEASIGITVTATSADGSTSSQSFTLAVSDVNEAAVSAISDTNAVGNNVNENATVGTSVGITAFASDADGTATISYSLTNDAGGKFAIDSTTGEVTVAGALDREVAANYQIEVTATSTDGSTSTQTYTIGLNDQDEFDVSLVSDTNAAANGLAENAAPGTAVGVVAAASDADATTNAVTYSVDDARFTVDADGTVRVAAGASFDYETESSVGITVTATSADGSTSSQAFTLAVSDINEAAVSAISDTNAAGNTVNENAAVGTSVGITAFASDADGTSTVSYSLSNDAGGKFAIDPTTGEVTVAGALDRETAASYQIEVTATSSDGSTSTQTYTIGLNDQDEFDVSLVSDTNAAANGLAENAAPGTAVGVVAAASDADATTNAVTYSVDDARFTVDADGTVRVAAGASFDYETESSVGITVTATSADGSTSSQAFTLAVSDINEAAVSAISDTNAAGNTVNENAAVGTSVGITAFASDADGTSTVSYSLSNDAGGKFAIDPTTGEVTVAGALDRETAASYQIEVTATSSDGSTSTQTYTIGLNDQDEFDVSPVVDTSASADGLAEDAAAGTAVGVVASASDADATNNAISYSVDDARFTVDADGTVRVAAGANFDYETEASIGITVTATSADGSTSSQSFTLAVSDVNEAAVSAISDTNAAANVVNENATVGTSVGITAFASDADGTATISYSLSNDAGGKFAIDPTTGEVTVAGALDRETAASYQIEVTATSSDGSTSTQTYTIGLNDQDEFNVSPVSDTNATADAVSENAAVGTTVGIAAFASDSDATKSGVTYSLTDNAGGKFAINATTGVVTVAGAIDREVGATQLITVQATSADGSTSTQTYTIAVNDANEFAVSAVSDTNAAANTVTENAAIGTTMGVTAFASDADATGNDVTYSLSDSAGGKFAIDATTGVVTVAGAIDREAGATQSITVVATSSDGSTSSQTYSIAVNDVDEFDVMAISDSNATANAVSENATVGTTVGITASSSDADATNSGIAYSLSDSAGGKFAIDSTTGVVTVAGSIDRESGATQSITVVATSADGSTSSQTYLITVNDVNEFAVSAVSDTNAAANAVSENAAIGTTVGVTAFASDADATGNGVTYSLTDSAGGKFAINATTGVVTVAGAIDRESGATQSITVQATSADGSTSTQTYAITINDVDEFDVTAISDSNAAANAVSENAAVGTTVGVTAFASDADATNAGVTYSLSDSAGGKFAINSTTGVVTVAGAIDRESGATQSITVVATSADGSSSSQTYAITVNDVNEFAVSAVSDSNASANAVSENAAIGTTVGVTAFASDADATGNGVTYSLTDSAGGKFAINSTTGVVTVAGAIDRESGATQSITVQATSADGSVSTQTYSIAINDVDEFDVTAISDSNAAANAVTENAAVGTTVGITAAASDADSTNSGITYSLSDSAGGKFAINATTGVVTVAGAIDRESGATQSITVVATSADGSSSTQTYSIAVNDVDEFDVTAISDSNATANAVAENAAVGTTVGVTAFAPDADATSNGVTYSLTDSAGGKFAINATTGVVTVAGAIDREAGATQSITVQATSADGSTSTQTYAITINDVDEFDVTAISDSNAAANAVTENATVGTTVGITAAASDADATNSGITYSLSDSAGGKFAINSTTGVVTVAGAIDRESGATQSITVVATSADGSTSSQTYSIAVNDVDEFDVTAISDGNATANAVSENATVGTTVGITASASDADATNSGITYSLSDSAGGKFAINATTGVVTVAGAIDRESGATQSITVVATSADGSTSSQTYSIAVNDVNEFAVSAVSDTNATANAVSENAAVGTTVGVTAFASDADATGNGVTYSLTDSAGGKFAINATTGVVTVAGAIDRESGATQSITVQATSADGSTSTQTYVITINDVDEFDVTAISDSNAAANAVTENAAVGTTVGVTAFASDADATGNGVTYSLTDSAGGKFAINATTGVVTVAGAIDRESGATQSITVVATSADGSTSSQTYSIAVADVDEFDVTAITDGNATANAVSENATVGTTVGITASASDADATNSGITYSLSDSAGGKFAINATTGVVTVAGAIDRESGATQSITVVATSADGSTSSQTYSIAVNDVNEFAVTTVSDTNAAANAVSENAAVGTTVGVTAFASDADATGNGVTYSLTDSAGGKFAINATTGVVTVAGAIDREAGATQSITVQATSADGSTSTQTYAITINDVDEFDVTAISDSNATANAVSENAAVGTTVGNTAFASDADATNSGITYSLTDSAGGKFAINSTTGVVTVAGAIDRESGATQSITVQATSADGSTSTQTYAITINDVDEFDVTAISDSNAIANAVTENAAIGATVGVTAFASDADATGNGVTYSLSDSSGGMFAINSTTGVVTVAGAIDREAGATQSITVVATSADGSTSSQTYSIAVNDVDEFDVTAISDSNATANSVTENAAVGTTVGITASASDADASNSGVTYSLSDSAGGKFAINSTTGVVTVAGAIDREAGATQSITVVATSADGSTSSQTYSVAVADVDEFNVGAISDSNASSNAVNENAAVGTTVGITASASDADATTSGITYSLTDSAGGKFAINSSTGVVTVAGALNYETATSHSITVLATSADGSTSTQSYTVGVNDLNDETPTNIMLSNSTINEEGTGKISFTLAGEKFGAAPIVEVFSNGVSLGTVTLTSAHDTQLYGSASLAQLDAIAQTFTLNMPFGVIDPGTISFKLLNDNYDPVTGYDTNFYVKNVSVGETGLNGSQGSGAATTSGVWAAVVSQDSPISFATPNGGWDTRQIVGTLTTTDADASNSFTYSITSDPSGLFTISGDEIIVKPGMETNYEANTSHTITVQVNDGNGHTYSKNLTIGVNDINEKPTDIQFTGNSELAITDGGTLVGAKVDAHPDLRVAYALDEGTGTTATALNGTSTLTLMNGANWTSAPVGAALDFAGGTTNSGAQAQIAPFVSTGAISVSMYARMDNVDGGTKEWQRLFDFGNTNNTMNGGQVFNTDDMRLEVILNGVYYSVVAPDAIDDGEWAHWSFTVSETGMMSIYKNGDLLAQNQGAVPNLDGNGVYRLGASSFSGDDSLDGAIADFTIHTDDLTPAEVSVLANQSSLGFTADNSIANVSGVSNYISGDTFSYSLTDSAGGAFAINSATGAITLTQEFAVPGGDPEFVLQNGSISPFNGFDQGSYGKPQMVDIDNDGDLDLFLGRDSGGLAYYKNTGSATNPNFVFQQHNPFTLNSNTTYGDVSFVDINNDGDMDAFVSDSTGNTQYFQNTGTASSPSFAAAVNNPFGLSDVGSHSSITFADLDGDGDKDAIIGDDAGNLDYFQNTGTASSPTFTYSGANLFDLADVGTYASPEFADFDGDGDLDALVGRGDGQLVYFENTGTAAAPNFALSQTNPFGLTDIGDNANIDAADIDGDGDVDLLVGKSDGTIAYFKNVATQSGSAYSDTVTVKVTNGAGQTYSETIGIQFGTDGNDTLTGTAASDIIYGMDEAGTTSGTNLIVNGSFESLDVANVSVYTSMAGWSASSGSIQLVDESTTEFGGAAASDGRQFIEMDAAGSVDVIYQSVQTLAGVQYKLGLDVAARSFAASNTIQIFWNGALVQSVNPTSTSFQSHEFTVTGTGGLDKLEFRELSAENDSAGGLIDNVSLFVIGGDTLSGAAGDDAIYGGAGNDKLYGDDGNDTLAGGAGADLVFGGAGTDTLTYAGSAAAVSVNLSSGGNISGGDAAGDTISGIENLIGSNYSDTLTGDGNDNTIWGGLGNDTLGGGAGNDSLIGGAGADTMDGGTGTDTVSYEGSNAGVNVNLATGAVSGGHATGDVISNFENIIGSGYNDTLAGDGNANVLSGGDGADTLSSGGGTDTVYGGNGDDTITGGSGNDFLQGDAGSDTFIYIAGDGSDTVNGGAAGGWTDIISLQGMDGSIVINGATLTGQGWTMHLDSGTFGTQSGESLNLGTDADGTITFTDGSVMTFTDIDRVTW